MTASTSPSTSTSTSPDLPPQVGVLVELSGSGDLADVAQGRRAAHRGDAAEVRDARRGPRRGRRERASPRRGDRAARRASPRPPSTGSSRARVNGFFKDNVLVEQSSAKDQKKTVEVRARGRRRDRPPVRPLPRRLLTVGSRTDINEAVTASTGRKACPRPPRWRLRRWVGAVAPRCRARRCRRATPVQPGRPEALR